MKTLEVVKWSGSTMLFIGAVLTSLQVQNINLLFMILGNLLWLTAGIMMRDISIWMMSIGIILSYSIGPIIRHFT